MMSSSLSKYANTRPAAGVTRTTLAHVTARTTKLPRVSATF
jgi:hypothetical protein